MIETRSTRLLALLVLAGILCGLLLWAGTLGPNPDRNAFADEDAFAVDYDAYVGERIEFGGTVLATDPVVVEATADSGRSLELTLRSLKETDSISPGDEITFYGVLEIDNTVTVIDTTVRQPWESAYITSSRSSPVSGRSAASSASGHSTSRHCRSHQERSTRCQISSPTHLSATSFRQHLHSNTSGSPHHGSPSQ